MLAQMWGEKRGETCAAGARRSTIHGADPLPQTPPAPKISMTGKAKVEVDYEIKGMDAKPKPC